MMKFLRTQSQTVLVVVLGVIGLGFLFYGNAGNLLTTAGGHAVNDYGRIDGEDLSVAELYDAVRNTRDMIILNGGEARLNQPGVAQQVAQEAWLQLLLQREANRLHITISNQELVDYIKSLPPFQKDGVFSPDLYKTEMKVIQTRLHVPTDAGVDAAANTQATLETLLRNTLQSKAISDALFSNVHSSAHEVADQYGKYYGPATVSYVTFDPKTITTTIPVSPAEVEAEYKNNPTNPAYRTKEKRKVDYVFLLLSPDQVKLPEDQKKKLIDVLGQRALDFALEFQPDPSAGPGATFTPPDFIAEGKKNGLAPGTTDFFTADSTPANLPPSPAFNSAAFSLTKDNTISKVVELDNGVAVLHLAEIQPSELRPLDEVKGDIEKQLQQNKSLQAAQTTVKLMAQILQSAVAHGTDFKAAAAGAKLKVETVPTFIPVKAPPTDQRLQTIAYASTSLKPGEVSGPIPMQADNTFIILHLDSRAPADASNLADETRLRNSQDQQLQSQLRADWANWKSKQNGTHKPQELDSYGTAE